MSQENRTTNQRNTAKYNFEGLKVYASTEWLAGNNKKYRQVFEKMDTGYIYAELSFVNKLYDRQSWTAQIQLKCFQTGPGRKEICSLDLERKVGRQENLVFVREGWGNRKNGNFWKVGNYQWEAYIDGVLVGSKYFHVIDREAYDMDDDEDYLKLSTIKMYDGGYDNIPKEERKYRICFDTKRAKYIYLEGLIKNLNPDFGWSCELFVKFFNESKELKGLVVRLIHVQQDQEYIDLSAGWGSNIPGSWSEGYYTCELVFMDQLLATIPFEVSDEIEEGYPEVLLPGSPYPRRLIGEDEEETIEEVLQKLGRLIGLETVKQKIAEQAQYIEFIGRRKDMGFREEKELNLHSVFVGNPGTGKTTVARMLGKIYKNMGVLSRGHVHEVDRVELVGEYIGQTAPKVRDAIEKARGGVLFIDEAYALARSEEDNKDFGREVIEMLIKELSDGVGDLVVVVAGYPQEMKRFLDSNPGLRSRFKMYYEFHDYLPEELMDIALLAAEEKEVHLSAAAKKDLALMLTREFRARDRSFGNARYVHDIMDQAKIQLGLRVMSHEAPEDLSRRQWSEITRADMSKVHISLPIKRLTLPIDEKELDMAMKELDALIGMRRVKDDILETVQLIRYHLSSGQDVLHKIFAHTVFIGNPGTGKTTVARILTKIYKALGILERGHIVETDRQGLVAGYVGQTALKTAQRIDEAIGGVLFIDEAYALGMRGSSMGDFGDEAIQTILKRMEDDRGRFYVFAAGYPDNMESFLKTNPGLSSRFDKTLYFEDYSAEELNDIANKILDDKGFFVRGEAKLHLRDYVYFLHQFRDKYFGNARAIRKVVEDVIKYQNLRISRSDDPKINPREVLLVDLNTLRLKKEDLFFKRRGIGFNKSGNS